jgi:hypothetical protein
MQGTHLKNRGDENGIRIRKAEKCSAGVGCRFQIRDSTDHRRVLSACLNSPIFSLVTNYLQRALSGGYVRSAHASHRVHGALVATALWTAVSANEMVKGIKYRHEISPLDTVFERLHLLANIRC